MYFQIFLQKWLQDLQGFNSQILLKASFQTVLLGPIWVKQNYCEILKRKRKKRVLIGSAESDLDPEH